jgi:hypothetical protein
VSKHRWTDAGGGMYTITEDDPQIARSLLAQIWGADYDTLRELSTDARQCFWLDETCVDPNGKGFIPSLVTEGEPGHSPLKGDPEKFQSPWVWGPTIQDAKRQVREANEALGITPEQATDIVLSSMAASR